MISYAAASTRSISGIEPLLQLHLETAGIADAAHRRRRDGDDEGLFDRLKPAEQMADDHIRPEWPCCKPLLEGPKAREDGGRRWRHW